MNLYAVIALVAIGAFAAIEVMIAYQKYQLKKQFQRELDTKSTEES